MSTYWYFECMDHDPHLSGQEFTQHTDDDAYRKGIELAHARPLDHSWWDGDQGGNDGYFERNARHFLDGHPSCRLGVVSDHGERRDDIPGTSRAASDRAILDRVREALTWHPTCDVHPDDDVITCGWKKAVASITWVLRDEQDGGAERTDWVDDAAPLPRPERNDE